MRAYQLASVLGLSVLLCGCPEGDEPDVDAPDAGPPPPVVDYDGTYAADGTWDLSGPFSDEDGVGGAVADLVIREAVARSGVPSSLEDEAASKLSGVAREPIADFVNDMLPATLAPGGQLLADLGRVLASADVASSFSISSAGSSVTGNETVASIGLVNGTDTLVLTPADLLPGGGAPEIRASVSGRRTSGGFVRDPAVYQIYVGAIVERVVEDLLGADLELSSQAIVDAIDCQPLVDAVTGGGSSISITVGGMTVSISASDLLGACDQVALAAADKALGVLSRDTPITLGGSINVTDLDGDEIADRMSAGSGYGGSVAIVDPIFDPRVTASFTATRQ